MRIARRTLLILALIAACLRPDGAAAQRLLFNFGSPGMGDGQFGFPVAVAIDPEGRIWVGDVGRVQVFDASGGFLFRFGSFGRSDGQFDRLTSLAIDRQGDVYVGDSTARVQIFDRNGRFVSSFGPAGDGDGHVAEVTALAVDSHRQIYVGDHMLGRVKAFDRTGKFLFACEQPDGQPLSPIALAIDRTDWLYVVDDAAKNIVVYRDRGKQLFTVGEEGHLNQPVAIAVDRFGITYVVDAQSGQNRPSVKKFERGGRFFLEYNLPLEAAEPAQVLSAIAADAAGDVFVADSSLARVSKLDLLRNYLFAFGRLGMGDGEFVGPNSVAINQFNDVFVADFNSKRVQRFDYEGRYMGKFGDFSPSALTTDPLTNFLFVADFDHSQLLMYELRGPRLRRTIGGPGSGDAQFNDLRGVSAGKGILYVADRGNGRVQYFRTGDDTVQFSGAATYSAAKPFFPTGVGAVPDGVVATDANNQQAVKFDREGRFVRVIGSPGQGDGQFDSIQYVAGDSEGGVYVSDNHNEFVQRFTPDGRFDYKFGGEGTAPNNLHAPEGMAVSPFGRIYVADYFASRVVVYAEDLKRDHDGDGLAGANDADRDGDGIADAVEGDADSDGDGIVDALDLDADQDGICDVVEVGLPAGDDCLIADAADENGNGLADSVDPDAGAAGLVPRDGDGDGTPDYRDGDADDDGRCDVAETRGGRDANRDCVYDDETDLNEDGLADALYYVNGRPLVLIDSDRDDLHDTVDPDDGSSSHDDDGCAIVPPATTSRAWLLLGALPLLILLRRRA